ncbi:MAG: uroporphyrinogen decarboxylase [Candidatus Electronema aureum]|uniref:Uroporphyrinogen decarboxylase n=1 Tax=Candidatus Electronema aureum TaxID=2005002 RepID=A0A521G1M3_9BACT|nr:MAG: uroporphyrinogen decarboxylase [Candidatus Electronema aureum]
MSNAEMTSMERVLTTLSHREPDRVPFFLLLTMHGAKELGLSIREYFSQAKYVIEGQCRLRAKYHHDCFYPLLYGAAEAEAFGGEIVWYEDGPPNSGAPVLKKPEDILALQVPVVDETPCLCRMLDVISGLKERAGNTVPIIGVVISPFSLPVMQMGFAAYIELLYEQPELFARLMAVNQAFCVAWANAQFQAGATTVCYFDPLASPDMIPPEMYRRTGLEMARQCLSYFNGPACIHLGSGRCLAMVEELAKVGAVAAGVSALDDLAAVKAACKGKITVAGNLNGIEMRRWTPTQAEAKVKEALAAAAAGGGFILTDNHGEIPWQVSDEILLAISAAVQQWGRSS